MLNIENVRQEIKRLQKVYKDLDHQILMMMRNSILDYCGIQQARKEKTTLKDQIQRLESQLPDIIA